MSESGEFLRVHGQKYNIRAPPIKCKQNANYKYFSSFIRVLIFLFSVSFVTSHDSSLLWNIEAYNSTNIINTKLNISCNTTLSCGTELSRMMLTGNITVTPLYKHGCSSVQCDCWNYLKDRKYILGLSVAFFILELANVILDHISFTLLAKFSLNSFIFTCMSLFIDLILTVSYSVIVSMSVSSDAPNEKISFSILTIIVFVVIFMKKAVIVYTRNKKRRVLFCNLIYEMLMRFLFLGLCVCLIIGLRQSNIYLTESISVKADGFSSKCSKLTDCMKDICNFTSYLHVDKAVLSKDKSISIISSINNNDDIEENWVNFLLFSLFTLVEFVCRFSIMSLRQTVKGQLTQDKNRKCQLTATAILALTGCISSGVFIYFLNVCVEFYLGNTFCSACFYSFLYIFYFSRVLLSVSSYADVKY